MRAIEIPRGATRTYRLRVQKDGAFLDLSGWQASVIVDADTDETTAPIYGPVPCPLEAGDSTARLITVGGAATAGGTTRIKRRACVHLVSPDGEPDSIEREILIVPHA
jgi:hypothetical protein